MAPDRASSGRGGGTPTATQREREQAERLQKKRESIREAMAAQASFSVRCFAAICGPEEQFWLKVGNTVTPDDFRRLMWNHYMEFLQTQSEHYPSLSPDVADYEVVLALPDGQPDPHAPALARAEPLKPQMPKPAFLLLVIGGEWLDRDAMIRRQSAARSALEDDEARSLVVVRRVGVMHRLKHQALERRREEAERRSTEFERRAVAAFLVEQQARDTARRQRDAFRAMQQAYDEFLPTVPGIIAGYDSRRRALLAASRCLLRTVSDVGASEYRAGRDAARERQREEEAHRRLAGRPLVAVPAFARDAGHWEVADLHADAEGRRQRRGVIDHHIARCTAAAPARAVLALRAAAAAEKGGGAKRAAALPRAHA